MAAGSRPAVSGRPAASGQKAPQIESQKGARMEPKRAPKWSPFGSSQMSRNALISLCFRTKTAPAGSPKVLQKGARNESKKGVKKEPEMEQN